MSPDAPRRCYIHIGLQKTGTSFLQSVMWESREELSRQGVELLPGSRDATFELMTALLGRKSAGDDEEAARRRALDRLSEQAARLPASAARVVVSEESLSGATGDQARALATALPGFETHVVMTVRDLARQLPSVWQQKVKAGRGFEYSRFVDDVLARRPAADPFWSYQDVPEILRRWQEIAPPERIHVVTVPPPGSPPGVLLARFCSVVGADAAGLSAGTARPNPGLGLVQAELLRRVNVARDHTTSSGLGYGRTRKFYLAGKVLAAQRGEPPRAPARVAEWCTQTAKEHIAVLSSGGFDVVGDLADLLPDPGSFSSAPTEVTAVDVVESAALAISQMLVDRDRDRTELRQLRRRVAELSVTEKPGAQDPDAAGPPSRAARLRRRLGRTGA